MGLQIPVGSRIRKSPFHEALLAHGLTHATVYNHMLMPASFGDPGAEYEALVERVSLWDVACERQVEVVGPEAFELVQYVSARDMAGCAVGRVRYAPICDHEGTLLNDPMILKLAEDRFWFSIADSDLLLWVRAVGAERGLDCRVFEPDASPLGVQGPRADDTMAALLGEWVRDVPFFSFVDGRCGTPCGPRESRSASTRAARRSTSGSSRGCSPTGPTVPARRRRSRSGWNGSCRWTGGTTSSGRRPCWPKGSGVRRGGW